MRDVKAFKKEKFSAIVQRDESAVSFIWDPGARLDQVLSDRLSLRRTAQVWEKPGWWRLLEG